MLPHFLEVFSLHLTTPTLILGMRVSCDAPIGPATGTLILTFLRLQQACFSLLDYVCCQEHKAVKITMMMITTLSQGTHKGGEIAV
ncbi:hypothetical protein BJV77DRAFT_985643 [Russula vinacea]|nr:hypothetical protein BJV77DRAFT_985643 [Russula vinacea]